MGILAAVSKLINALAPINKLPPEILGMIPKYDDGQTPKRAVAVSSVCSYWRNTFTSTPSLWTRFNGKGVEKSQAWVERSGALPIQLSVRGSPDPEVLELLEPHFPRLKVVDFPELVAQDRSLFMNNLLPKLLRPSPILRKICLQILTLENPGVPVPLTGEFPSLDILRIVNFPISITNLHAPNLRKLGLTGQFDLESSLDLLESSPLLERLDFTLPPDNDVLVIPGRKILLKKVNRANFIANGFKLLQHLLLPACDEIVLNISPTQLHDFTEDHSQLLSPLLDGLSVYRQVRSMTFNPSNHSITLVGPNGGLTFVAYGIRNLTKFIALLHFLAQHSIKTIQELRIPNLQVPPTHFDLINGFVKSLESLRTLYIHQSFATQCLLALGASHCLQLEATAVWCPPPFLPDYEGLKGFAKGRREAGVPVQHLSVCTDCKTFVELEVTGS